MTLKKKVERSIPQRLERIVQQHPGWIAVKTQATRVISRVRETFPHSFPYAPCLNLTVARLAVQISPIQAGHCAPEMAELVADLESVSDEKAQLSLDQADLSVK